MTKNMSDLEFMENIEKGISGILARKFKVGDLVTTVGLDSPKRKKSSVGIVSGMIEDCLNKSILTVVKCDESDNTIELSNGYWYEAEYLELV